MYKVRLPSEAVLTGESYRVFSTRATLDLALSFLSFVFVGFRFCFLFCFCFCFEHPLVNTVEMWTPKPGAVSTLTSSLSLHTVLLSPPSTESTVPGMSWFSGRRFAKGDLVLPPPAVHRPFEALNTEKILSKWRRFMSLVKDKSRAHIPLSSPRRSMIYSMKSAEWAI